MSFRTLDNWVRIGLVTCSQVAGGRGTRRAWTVDDVTRVAYLQVLHKNGISTQRLNAMAKSGTLGFVLDNQLEKEKVYGDKYVSNEFILVVGHKALVTTIWPKRQIIEKAFDTFEAGLLPEPLMYDDAPLGKVWVGSPEPT